MILTPEVIRDIEHYATKLFHFNRSLQNEELSDIKQEALLLALELDTTHIGPALLYKHTMDIDELPYKLPKKFSELAPGKSDETREDYIERLKPFYNVFKQKKDSKVIKYISTQLYDKDYLITRFLDYMYGMSVGGSYARNIREKMFNNRFAILEMLKTLNGISIPEYNRYYKLAQELKEKPKAKRPPLSQNKTAERCRRFYENNLEEQRARLRDNYHRTKAKKALENAK